MDLKIASASATDAEREAVDALLGPPPEATRGAARGARDHRMARGGASLRAMRPLMLPVLHAINDRVGWLSRGAINYVSQRLDVAPADVYGVATFYALFSTTERPARQVHVCIDLACRAAGGHTETDLPAGTHASPCLGLCERAPALMVIEAGPSPTRAVAGPVTRAAVRAIADGAACPAEPAVHAAVPQAPNDALVLLRRAGRGEPSLASYLASGGYAALRRAHEIGPAAVVDEVVASGLVGRGGAAFPTGRKWAAVAQQPATPHHLVCNADESEPGTFKDRVLMESDPFGLLEAMTIAAYATGCERGWVYLRGEYPRAEAALRGAIAEARARGWLGARIGPAGQTFDVEIVRGGGAYICGEETAIFNSIEGHRGEPRNKPPYPVEVGLFGKPTVVNNVETLMNVPAILAEGGGAYAAWGTEGSRGRKLFCVSGAVARPGVYEVDFGATLRDLIGLAGGVRPGAALRAVLLGGAAGGFVGPEDLDLPLTLEAARAAGTTLGSGVVLVLDESVDLVDQLMRIADFFHDESCGQCVPCRVGTVRQREALARLVAARTEAGARRAGDLALLRELAQVMRDASICGLGQTAPNAIDSAISRLGVLA